MKTVFSKKYNNTFKYFIFPVCIILMAFAMKGLYAQDQALIEVNSEVDTSVITIGDRINYTITINRDKNLQIKKPGEGLNLGMFEIKDYNFPEPVEKDGRIIEKYEFNISVYDTGKFTIPPFPIAYFPEGTDSTFKIIKADPIDIYVKSVISGDDAKELKDIKFPIRIPFNYRFWVSIGVVVVLLLLIAYLAYLVWKRRKEKGYIFSPPPPPISDIIRAYLEGRYFFSALEETTAEIMRDAQKQVEQEELLIDLKNILEISDLVKFAKYFPEENEINDVKIQALNFINVSKLIYEEVDTGEINDVPREPEQAEVIPVGAGEIDPDKTE
ncbi:MAG: hypothetical protein P8X42_04505 [Calditrichaceae bacterium]